MRLGEERGREGEKEQKREEGLLGGFPLLFPFPPPFLKPAPISQNSLSVLLPVCFSLFSSFFPLFSLLLLPLSPPSTSPSSPPPPRPLSPPKAQLRIRAPGPGPGPIVSHLFQGCCYASGSRGKRKIGGGSRSFPTFLHHQLFRSGSRKIDACAKRDNNPWSMCSNPCIARAATSQRNAASSRRGGSWHSGFHTRRAGVR